ncbi:hypothetical protein AB9K26_00220 [Psychroserpens sp. XS_ASV72]|uniref:hypothetical protein n=1 Tax=Psychroserpens sp. XS_ASV72 TaxID=3241293 RepID=UPI00351167D9
MKFFAKTIDPNSVEKIQHPYQKVLWNGLIGLLFVFFIALLNEYFWRIDWLDKLVRFLAIICVFIIGYSKISLVYKKQKTRGKNIGYLRINEDNIELDDKIYDLNRIKNLKIELKDFSGKFIDPFGHSLAPGKSSGVENSIYFEFDKTKIYKNFFIQNEEQFELATKLKTELEHTVANNV